MDFTDYNLLTLLCYLPEFILGYKGFDKLNFILRHIELGVFLSNIIFIKVKEIVRYLG